MNSKHNSLAFAQAIFDLSIKEEKIVENYQILQNLSSLLIHQSKFRDFILSPIIEKIDKKHVIDKLNLDSNNLRNFFYILIDKNIFYLLDQIFSDFQELYNLHFNIQKIIVYSAKELLEQEKSRIENLLAKKLNKNIEAKYIVDSSLILGLKIKINDIVYDNTALKKMMDIKQLLLN